MGYDSVATMTAWKKFVNTGILDETHIRPEIARSWLRCREYKLDPWSATFEKPDEQELKQRRSQYQGLIDAAGTVLQYLTVLFNCNTSLSDLDGFVFELDTPLASYPRTLGTFIRENQTGTGNLPLALFEKKLVRVDGFEHYRVVAQNYSGVSVPMQIPRPAMGAILNINNPFAILPEEAPEIAAAAAKLIEKLCGSRQKVFSFLSSAVTFNDIIEIKNRAVIILDHDGMILTANSAGRKIVTEYDKYPYAGQPFGDYLKDKHDLFFLLNEPFTAGSGRDIAFIGKKGRQALKLSLLRSKTVHLENGLIHNILIFENPEEKVEEAVSAVVHRQMDTAVDYIGQCAAWQAVDTMVRKIAPYKSNVLLLGATGTGKEVVARAIHRLSGRTGEFVPINCGAIPRDLLASELFGYAPGAYTGAQASGAAGKFEYANGGTLFLDEIGEMPLDMQVALLRVLQEQVVTRVGSNEPKFFDVRVIAATNQDIEQLIREKKFRADLRYRLSVIEIKLPLLRDRRDDIPLLARYFNETLAEALHIPPRSLSQEVEELLSRYDWPGNVRELKNVIEKALVLTSGKEITPGDLHYLKEWRQKIDTGTDNESWEEAKDIYEETKHAGEKPEYTREKPEYTGEKPEDAGEKPEDAREKPEDARERSEDAWRISSETAQTAVLGSAPDDKAKPLSEKQQKELREKKQIMTLIEKNRGNLSRVAKDMNFSRNTLYRKIHKYGIQISVYAHQAEPDEQ